jgi:hypothetical protein
MTYSPIISAAGAVPDPAATDPAAAAADPAAAVPDPGAASPDPGAASPDPAAAVPDPATAPDPGIGPGQVTEPAADASFADYSADQASAATGQADSSAGYTGHGGYSADQASAATGQADSSADYTGHGGYSADQAGAAEHAAYSADQGAYSADAAGPATDSTQQNEAGAAWPHQTFLELGALATAAPCARLHTTLVLWEWDLGTLIHTAGLVVSELVSNAVQASADLTGSRFAGYWAPGTPPVRVWLSADDHRVVIQVWDGSDRPPVPQAVAPEADSGRGLLLVGALSEEWGCYTPEKSSGKVVWAVVTA